MDTKPLEIWAIVELFGHNRIVGLVSEQQIAGANMVRIDVPEIPVCPAWTRFLNPSAIYAINPVTKEVAIEYAKSISVRPIESWDAREVLKRIDEAKRLAPAGDDGERDGDD